MDKKTINISFDIDRDIGFVYGDTVCVKEITDGDEIVLDLCGFSIATESDNVESLDFAIQEEGQDSQYLSTEFNKEQREHLFSAIENDALLLASFLKTLENHEVEIPAIAAPDEVADDVADDVVAGWCFGCENNTEDCICY